MSISNRRVADQPVSKRSDLKGRVSAGLPKALPVRTQRFICENPKVLRHAFIWLKRKMIRMVADVREQSCNGSKVPA